MLNKIKLLAQDTAVYGVFRILGKMLSFLLTPIYANYFLGQDFLFLNFIFPVIAVVKVIYSLGLEMSFFRFYDLENKEKARDVFSSSFTGIGITAIFITVFIQIFAADLAQIVSAYVHDESTAQIPLERLTFLIRISALIPLIEVFSWIPFDYLRMVRKAKKFSLVSFLSIVLTVGLVAIAVPALDMGVEGVLYATIAGQVFILLCLKKEIFAHLTPKINRSLLKEMYVFGIPVMLGSLPAMLLQVFDKILMPGLSDTLSTNTYAVFYKMGIPMMLLVTMFDYAWKPFFMTHYKESDSKRMFSRVYTYFTLAAAGVFLLVSFYMPLIVRIPFIGGKPLIPELYWGGMSIVPIVLAGYYFNGAITNFVTGFHITRKTKYITLTMWAAAGVNIGMNYLLIPIYGGIGAAWSTLAAYAVGAFTALIIARKIYPVAYEWRRVILTGLLTAAIYFPVERYTADIPLIEMALWRSAALAVFLVLLRLFGFFTPGELKTLKGMFLKRKA